VAAPSTTMATVEEIREFGDNTEHLSNGLLGPPHRGHGNRESLNTSKFEP